MRLIVDVGNSRAKVVVLDNRGTTLEERITESITSKDVTQLIERHPDIRKAIVATTRGNGAELKALLKEHIDYVLHFDPATTPIPIGNLYHTPKTLGADRLAAAVGVAAMYPATDIMVIDFGTAITIDYVVGGAFVGGNISPGVTTRFRALADYTASTSLSLFTFMHWRRKWQPTPVFLPGESQGQWSLVGCRLWGRTESDTTEAT